MPWSEFLTWLAQGIIAVVVGTGLGLVVWAIVSGIRENTGK